MNHGTLFVVATPLGNLDDLSQRARQVLTDADLIAAEDTRRTGRLLMHFGIKNRQIALHDHNEGAVLDSLILQLKNGKSVALVSDAGTPLISDPGYLLVRAAHGNAIPVSPVPGASACIAALSASGLATDRFCFAGFLPAKNAARTKCLQALCEEPRTQVFFESVHRVPAVVNELAAAFGSQRQAFIARELTKLHEQCVNAELGELAVMLEDGRIPVKGEFVIVVAGAEVETDDQAVTIAVDDLLEALVAVLPPSQAAATAAEMTGLSRNDLYRKVLALKTGNIQQP